MTVFGFGYSFFGKLQYHLFEGGFDHHFLILRWWHASRSAISLQRATTKRNTQQSMPPGAGATTDATRMVFPGLPRTTRVVLSIVLLLSNLMVPADTLLSGVNRKLPRQPSTRHVPIMGLFDDPLPPRKSPGDEEKKIEDSASTKKELDEFRAKLKKQEQKRKRDEYLSGKPDTDWLPIQNPKPVDDEPWFTG